MLAISVSKKKPMTNASVLKLLKTFIFFRLNTVISVSNPNMLQGASLHLFSWPLCPHEVFANLVQVPHTEITTCNSASAM